MVPRGRRRVMRCAEKHYRHWANAMRAYAYNNGCHYATNASHFGYEPIKYVVGDPLTQLKLIK